MSIVGIDFGTSNSCISEWNKDKAYPIQNDNGELTTPTVLYFGENNEILFGDIGRIVGERDPQNLIINIKRLVGKTYKQLINDIELYKFFKNNNIFEIEDDIYFKIRGKIYSVSDLICIYLNYIKHFRKDIESIVITVPAYFNDTQRVVIKNCCEKVGFQVLRVINEPTAAALAYKNESDQQSSYVLIFDCGGGTTDLSLMYMDYEDNIYEVKDVVGDNFLGGEDLTQYLYEYISSFVDSKYLEKDRNKNKLRRACEMLKRDLSYKSESKINIEFEDTFFSKVITQNQFNQICKIFFDKIRSLIKYIIKDKWIDINTVVFVGGSTRVKYFETIFKEEIGQNIKICNNIDPDITVSVGAAIQCGLLTDSCTEGLLIDVIPLSLGVEADDGIMVPIISRNTVIPVETKREFLNSSDYDDTIVVNVYQGERRFVKDNYFLGEFSLKNERLREFPKGKITVYITFQIDTNSILTINAGAKINDEILIFEVNKINMNNTSNLMEILIESEKNKILDSVMENKIILKNELYESFKLLLSAYHKNSIVLDNYSRNILNDMYEKVFNVIRDFNDYNIDELKTIKVEFENIWHKLIFSSDIGGSTDINEI
jgi:molecular chaperone DnaK (HSP70)